MSVWTSVEALADYVYSGEHRAIMARCREFFAPMRKAFQVLWWVPEGTVPTLAEAEERLPNLRRHRPRPYAFTFRRPFPAPEGAPVQAEDGWLCPA